MPFLKKNVDAALEQALSQKSERKFTQSIDLAVNFRDVDFKKADQRLNVEVSLPFEPKPVQVCVFADGQLALDAKKAGADLTISSAEIDGIAKDRKKQRELLDSTLLAAPQLMVPIGKALGKILGAKGKTPKPIPPNANLSALISNSRKVLVLKAKGKFLPSVHCIVGRENQPREQVVENIIAILQAIEKSISEQSFKSIFVKTTMGKPVKIALTG
ncbi:MAG: 50S ribosomal protein L1 [Candidatus Micrarchaeota archaeon]